MNKNNIFSLLDKMLQMWKEEDVSEWLTSENIVAWKHVLLRPSEFRDIDHTLFFDAHKCVCVWLV